MFSSPKHFRFSGLLFDLHVRFGSDAGHKTVSVNPRPAWKLYHTSCNWRQSSAGPPGSVDVSSARPLLVSIHKNRYHIHIVVFQDNRQVSKMHTNSILFQFTVLSMVIVLSDSLDESPGRMPTSHAHPGPNSLTERCIGHGPNCDVYEGP